MKSGMESKVNGIAFFENGPSDGLPVVLIHGFPFDHRMWDPQTEALSKTHLVISYDLRGHGKSEVGDGQYTVELFVDDLLMLLDHLKVKHAVLCGLSLGGYIALRAVERHLNRFNGLVLCDTKSEADSNEAKVKRAASMQAVKKNGAGPFAEEFVKNVLSETTFKTKPDLSAFVKGLIQGNSPLGISGTLLALAARTDTTAALAKMALPALILVGEEDKLTPPANAESMAKALPQVTLRRIPQAAHLSNLENPSAFNESLLSFLKQINP